MNKDQQVRQQVSELTDGELEPLRRDSLLAELRKPEVRATWDLYHRIGDTLRCEHMATDPDSAFTRRLAERLAAEPALVAPQRHRDHNEKNHNGSDGSGHRGWRAALAAVAAAALGFVLTPSLFHSARDGSATAPMASSAVSSEPSRALLADAGSAATLKNSAMAEYLLLHQSANPSLYGAPVLARPVASGGRTEK